MKKTLNAIYGKRAKSITLDEYVKSDIKFTSEQYEKWKKEIDETPVVVINETAEMKEENEKLKFKNMRLKTMNSFWINECLKLQNKVERIESENKRHLERIEEMGYEIKEMQTIWTD